MWFINPALPVDDAHRILQQRGSTVIHNFLTPQVAHSLRTTLKAMRWNLAVSEQGKGRIINAESLAQDPAAAQQAIDSAWSERDTFSFSYHNLDLVNAYKQGEQAPTILLQLLEGFNTPEYHALLTAITGESEFTRVSAQATWYKPGDFLTMHNDFVAEELRYCAYVLSLADPWQPDWGGNLHLYSDDETQETRQVVPSFNSLTLFRTPQKHQVSRVAEHAAGSRISITGWLSRPAN